LFQKLLFAADEAICFHGLLREFCNWGIFFVGLEGHSVIDGDFGLGPNCFLLGICFGAY
jgi:hypothetical protein